jgi:hypothetical protein
VNAYLREHEIILTCDPADRSVAAAGLTVLAWTGDRSDQVLAAIAAAAESGDGRGQWTAWLSSVVLGRLPPGLAAPDGSERFGTAIAALEFGNVSAPPKRSTGCARCSPPSTRTRTSPRVSS